MANDQNNPEASQPGQDDRQLRPLITLFNWLVGEVITARIMTLRLAADLVRIGALPVSEINGVPLTQEIIDSVMSNFPSDPMWQALGRRLRNSLDALRAMDLENDGEEEEEYDEEIDDDDDDDELLADDDLDDEDEDEEDGPALVAEDHPGMEAQVIYKNPDHQMSQPEAALVSRISRAPGRNQN